MRPLALVAAAVVTAWSPFVIPVAAKAADLLDPPVFASRNHELSLLMVAAARPGTALGDMLTTAWTYEVCERPGGTPKPDACPAGSPAPLGGVRLQLSPGDTLRIRLVNKLPPTDQAKHAGEHPVLAQNPTNLHTHGLIVEPHRASGPSDTYGDYVFVEIHNPANEAPAPSGDMPMVMAGPGMHLDMDVVEGAAEYRTAIGKRHPSGLFWFHPHMHGLALNQVSAGLAGIITVGAPADACGDAACAAAVAAGGVRHLVLKDEQVEHDGTLLTQEDPSFCDGRPAAGEPPRLGSCAPTDPKSTHAGGRWFSTVNGQVYPDIPVRPQGEVWRTVNASGSRSYDLSLTDDATGEALPLQVLAVDGVAIDHRIGADLAGLRALMGGKVRPVRCPGERGGDSDDAVCTSSIRMMPSARVEFRVVRRDGGTAALSATFRTDHYATGPSGDDWPALALAHVILPPRATGASPSLALAGQARLALSPAGILQAPATAQVGAAADPVPLALAQAAPMAAMGATMQETMQDGLRMASHVAIQPDQLLGRQVDPSCAPLARGHRRRILFGNPTADNFGLGYEEVDAAGAVVAGSLKPVAPFDGSEPTVCITLGAGGSAVQEEWELVNLTGEDHNFHIHQTRFYLLSDDSAGDQGVPPNIDESLVLHDNVPVPHAADASGCDGTLAATMPTRDPVTGTMQPPLCRPGRVVVRIPFREIGDFVYHCHILEHEDGGMMARIRVVAPPVK